MAAHVAMHALYMPMHVFGAACILCSPLKHRYGTTVWNQLDICQSRVLDNGLISRIHLLMPQGAIAVPAGSSDQSCASAGCLPSSCASAGGLQAPQMWLSIPASIPSWLRLISAAQARCCHSYTHFQSGRQAREHYKALMQGKLLCI